MELFNRPSDSSARQTDEDVSSNDIAATQRIINLVEGMILNTDVRSTVISGYHRSPQYKDFSFGSRIRFGYEVEKESIEGVFAKGSGIGIYPLFKGFENDSSCGIDLGRDEYGYDQSEHGVEAITNMLSADAKDQPLIELLMKQAALIFDAKHNNRCSGHWTISATDMNKYELFVALRRYMGILYAMFPDRLNNPYCNVGKDLKHMMNIKESTVRVDDNNDLIECRLPGPYKSVEEAILRHRIFVTIAANLKKERVDANNIKYVAIALHEQLDRWHHLYYGEHPTFNYIDESLSRQEELNTHLPVIRRVEPVERPNTERARTQLALTYGTSITPEQYSVLEAATWRDECNVGIGDVIEIITNRLQYPDANAPGFASIAQNAEELTSNLTQLDDMDALVASLNQLWDYFAPPELNDEDMSDFFEDPDYDLGDLEALAELRRRISEE